MIDFFNWLAGGSISSLLFIIVVATMGISIPLIYLIAFFQNRNISFWPPTIGQRPSKDLLLKDKKLKGANTNTNEYQGFKLVDSFEDLLNEKLSIVRNAQEILFITGSRARDINYLQAIEQKVVSTPNLTHIRILFGFPHHQSFKNHLLNLIKIRNPYDRSSGKQRLFIGLFGMVHFFS